MKQNILKSKIKVIKHATAQMTVITKSGDSEKSAAHVCSHTYTLVHKQGGCHRSCQEGVKMCQVLSQRRRGENNGEKGLNMVQMHKMLQNTHSKLK